VLRNKYRNKDIEVDGGVGPSNIDIAAKVTIHGIDIYIPYPTLP